MIWKLKNLVEHTEQCHTDTGTKGWVPARPLNYRSWRRWLREVWLVMTGRADLVVWPGNQ